MIPNALRKPLALAFFLSLSAFLPLSSFSISMQVIIQGGDRWGHMFRIYDRDGEWTNDSLGSKTSFGTISLAKKGSSGDGVFHWFGSHDNRAEWHWGSLARTGSAWCRLYMDGVWSNWYGANIGQADFDYHDDHENHDTEISSPTTTYSSSGVPTKYKNSSDFAISTIPLDSTTTVSYNG